MGIVGPSGSGKSTLVRCLVGVWPALRGRVCLDGASLDQWPSSLRKQHIGYMPQTVELFPGTIAENISRLQCGVDDAAVVCAAKAAGVHELIVQLPDGYNTRVGESGNNLSAGQRQRIALARALFGNPFLVVLDEPNSNLDTEGERALARAIAEVRKRAGIVIVVAHRANILAEIDFVLVMDRGLMRAFGPKDEVLKSSNKSRSAPPWRVIEPGAATA